MSSVNLRSFRPFGDCKMHCNPKRVCKIGNSGTALAARAVGAIPGHCLRNLVISRRQYGRAASNPLWPAGRGAVASTVTAATSVSIACLLPPETRLRTPTERRLPRKSFRLYPDSFLLSIHSFGPCNRGFKEWRVPWAAVTPFDLPTHARCGSRVRVGRQLVQHEVRHVRAVHARRQEKAPDMATMTRCCWSG